VRARLILRFGVFNFTQRPICRSEFEMRAGKVAAALRRYLSGEKTRSAGGSSPKILIQESRVLTRC
jgi:hypothetical protein